MTIEIPLTKGYTAIIDDIDSDLAGFKWFALPRTKKNGETVIYAGRTGWADGRKVNIKMHQIVMERIVGGEIPSHMLCDHWDRNGINNARTNLRLATHSSNGTNRDMPSSNTSGFKGVALFKITGKWMSKITVNKKQIHLGYFIDPLEAHRQYCIAALIHHAPFHNFGANSPFAGMTLEQLRAQL